MSSSEIDLRLKQNLPVVPTPAVLPDFGARPERQKLEFPESRSHADALHEAMRQLVIDALEKSDNVNVLKACLAAAARLDGPRAAAAVERLCSHPNPQVSQLAELAAASPRTAHSCGSSAAAEGAKGSTNSIIERCLQETSASKCAALLALLSGRHINQAQEGALFEIANRFASRSRVDPMVRMALATALAGSEGAKAISFLLDTALDRNEDTIIRRHAIACLGRVTSSDAEFALARIALRAREPLMRIEAARTLGETGITKREIFRRMQGALYAPLASVRILAALALRGTSDRTTCMRLCKLLRSRNLELQNACADALKGAKNHEIIHTLIHLLLSRSARVACAAARALEGSNHRAVIENLDNRLQLSRMESDVSSGLFRWFHRARSIVKEEILLRLQCAKTLSLSSEEAATYVLLRATRDEVSEVARFCFSALAGRPLPGATALVLLESIATAKDPSILRAAASAAAPVDPLAAVRAISRRLTDPNSLVAEAAAQALQAIPHPRSVQVLISGAEGVLPDESGEPVSCPLNPAASAACARALAGFAFN